MNFGFNGLPVLVFLVGLLSIVAQVVLLRELAAAFYGVDLIYLLALGAWLLWTAAGALVARGVERPSPLGVAALLVGIGALVPLEVALIRGLRVLLGGVPGAFLPLPAQILASALCLLPVSVLLGLLFQWTAKRYLAAEERGKTEDRLCISEGLTRGVERDVAVHAIATGRSLATAYAIESVGGVAGGLATTWALHFRMPASQLALATGAVAFASAFLSSLGARPERSRGARPERSLRTRNPPRAITVSLRAVALAGLVACAVAAWFAPALDRLTLSWNQPDAIDNVDSPYGRVTIARRAEQVSVYENGALTLESEGTGPEEFAHLSLLQHASPERVLLLGGASAGLLDPTLRHGVAHVDDVELDASVVDALARHLPASFAASLSRPAVHLAFNDPRRVVARPGDTYDMIVIAAPEPASAQANRFFTDEFFHQCAAHLRPGGILSLRLPSLENAWTPPLVARTATIYAALRQSFSDVVVLPGATNIVLASTSRLPRDPQVLADRMASRGIHARLVTARYLRYLYSNDRYGEIEALLSRTRARPNSDANPTSYQATTILWLSKFVPSLANVDLASVADAYGWQSGRPWALAVVLCGLALLHRRRGWPRRALLVAIAALVGMALETVLLLLYQLKQGVVFQDLGMLLMAVMAGLAAGAWAVDRRVKAGLPRHFGPAFFLAALIALGLGVWFLILSGLDAGLLPIAAVLFATGAAVAGVFGWAAFGRQSISNGRWNPAAGPAEQRRLVSPLYAADVLGGCAGSVLASLVLIPLLGLGSTALWSAVLAAVALLLV